MSSVMEWVFEKHFNGIMIVVIVVIVGLVAALFINMAANPDYCDQACRQARYLSEVVQECEALDIYTRDECIIMTGGLR